MIFLSVCTIKFFLCPVHIFYTHIRYHFDIFLSVYDIKFCFSYPVHIFYTHTRYPFWYFLSVCAIKFSFVSSSNILYTHIHYPFWYFSISVSHKIFFCVQFKFSIYAYIRYPFEIFFADTFCSQIRRHILFTDTPIQFFIPTRIQSVLRYADTVFYSYKDTVLS